MIKFGTIAVLALLCLPMAASNAKPPDVAVQQIDSSADDEDLGVEKSTSEAGAKVRLPVEQQISSSSEGVSMSAQLTDESRLARMPAQLSSGKKSAQASSPLSKPSDGRRSAVERLEGEDRCDPALENHRDRDGCSRVIENRAAEFEREQPVLSPEERLLRLERQMAEADDARGAARRLATTGEGSDSEVAFGVAAIALQGSAEERSAQEPSRDAAIDQQALSEQILKAVIGGPPPP